jgi:hypothetical protein
MNKEIIDKINTIKSDMNCSKEFICITSNYEKLCKAKDFGLKDYVECNDENGKNCDFSFIFGSSMFCRCPLRVFICKELKK